MSAKKTPVPFFVPLSAALTAGVMLWLSRASYDVAGTSAAPVRVAMLPSPAELIGFVALALLIAVGLTSLLRTKATRGLAAFWEPATDTLLPLFALSLLVLPYLPWLADWMPSLRLLAGPGLLLLWVVVIGQVLWVFLPRLSQRLGLRSPVISPSKGAAIFGIAAVALSAPFALNVRHLPTAFVDLFQTVRHLPSAAWSLVPTGSLGVLFDQEYGIFPFAPVLLLAFIGIAGMLREPSHRRLAMALGIAALVLILLPGTLDPWWSKSAMPGQQLVLLLPLLARPIAWVYARLPRESLARAGAQLLLLFSMAVTLAIVLGLVPVRQEADGSSAVLQWMSPTWQLWSEAPTYVVGPAGDATVRVLVWLAVFAVAAWMFFRQRTAPPGRAALTVTVCVTLLSAALVSVTSVVLTDGARRFDVERRAVFLLLETFDPVARPIAVRYDPFSFAHSGELPSLFTASAVPGERTDPQPVRVVLNARFRLPAGRYALDLRGSDVAAPLPNASMALQLGREGRPIETWPLTLGSGDLARYEFEVPLDAEFVGFRAARQVERAITGLRLSPLSVVEARKRFPAATVLSAAVFVPARVFFHDSHAYPEAEGFWVRGRTTAQMTLQKTRDSDPDILVAVHSGARPNVVTLATRGWSQTLELVPGVTERVTVPSREGERFVPLTIASADGFVPAEIETSGDRRLLGAWIAFIRDDISRTSATP
jgi:hypothetical protein